MTPVNIPALAHSARPVVQIENGQAITISTEVARVFGKQHRHVLDAIRALLADLGEDRLPNFRQTVETRPNPSGGEPIKSPAYHLTRDGFTLLAMGFTGKRALAFKLAYIDAFNKMEAELASKPDHIEDVREMVAAPAPEPHKALSPAVAQEIAAQASQSILAFSTPCNVRTCWWTGRRSSMRSQTGIRRSPCTS